MYPSPNLGGRTTASTSQRETETKHHEDTTLAAFEDIRSDIRRNAETMRQVLEELKQFNPNSVGFSNTSTTDGPRGNRLKDIGAAYAVVAVFIASIDVGLLTYAHDYFSDRPEGTPAKGSDSVVNTLWFLSIIFAGVAAMLFAVMQVVYAEAASGAPSSRTGTADTNGNRDDMEKGRIDTNSTTGTSSRNPVHRARQRFTELHSSGVTAIVLLMLSMSTLFTGILVFVWSDQTKPVAIVVTIFFGLAWLVPKIPSSIFLSTASLLGL